jgi:hypothetical protein
MLHFVKQSPQLAVFLLLALFCLISIASPTYAADQCAGETNEADAACSAITGNTVCCVVQGQDNSCQTLPACVTLQANAASPTLTQPSTPTPALVTPTTVQQPGSIAAEGEGVLVNPLRAGSIPDLLRIVLKGLVQIGSIILVLALVWVGFLFVVAQGNEEKIRDARGALMWTVIGGLVLLGAQGIATLIQATVNAL